MLATLKKYFKPANKSYVSDLDKFLVTFDTENPQQSPSQQAEIKKYERIGRLRDQASQTTASSKIWQDF